MNDFSIEEYGSPPEAVVLPENDPLFLTNQMIWGEAKGDPILFEFMYKRFSLTAAVAAGRISHEEFSEGLEETEALITLYKLQKASSPPQE